MSIAEKRMLEALHTAESGKLDIAARQLELSMSRGIVSEELLELYTGVIDQLGDPDRVRRVVTAVLSDEGMDLSVPSQIQMFVTLVRRESRVEGEPRRDILIELCNVAAVSSGELWEWASQTEMRKAITAALLPPAAGVELAEILLFVPERLGFRELAAQTIELDATATDADNASIRAAERLLHAAGIPEAAYRLEQTRRRRLDMEHKETTPSKESAPRLSDLVVAVAGGHPPFRTMAREALEEEGGAIREIPSRFESVRRERDVVDALKGSDVAVIVVPQISHSTSDQITRVSRRLGLPVLYLRSASVATLMSLLRVWRQETGMSAEDASLTSNE